MRLLILGGSGFLGQTLIQRLIQQGIAFDTVTRTPQKLAHLCSPEACLKVDLYQWETLDLSPYQCIINCAGELTDTRRMRALHVDATLGLLNQWAKNPSKETRQWIEVSSVGVYGKPRVGQVTENTKHAPIGEYESTKAEAEVGIQQLATRLGLVYTILRPSTVFGVGMSNQSLTQLIRAIRIGWFVYIGNNAEHVSMNYVPVEDVAECIVNCIRNTDAYDQDFIISDQMSLKAFVELITQQYGLSKRHFYTLPERPLRLLVQFLSLFISLPLTGTRIDALTTSVLYSSEKSKKQLKFMPSIGIHRGLIDYCKAL